MNSFLVCVPVPIIIVSRLSFVAVRVTALVWPAFYVDTHHMAVLRGFIHEAFTTFRTEKPLVGVVFMGCCHVSLEVLDSFPTELTSLWVVNPLVVLLFLSR